MTQLRSKYYRVSVKALVLNEERDKFLLMRQENNVWDLPGGGLDWGEKVHSALAREILEEMNVRTANIKEHPSYFLGGFQMSEESDIWVLNIVYEAELESLDFRPSDECQEVRFVSLVDLETLEKVPPTVQELAEQFKPKNHAKKL